MAPEEKRCFLNAQKNQKNPKRNAQRTSENLRVQKTKRNQKSSPWENATQLPLKSKAKTSIWNQINGQIMTANSLIEGAIKDNDVAI